MQAASALPTVAPPARRPRGGSHKEPVLTDEVQETIVQLLRTGNWAVTAASMAGVTRSTYERWIKQGEADVEAGIESPHAAFARACARASAQAEAVRVFRIQQAAERDWRADAWWLERRFPRRWGERVVQELEGGGRLEVVFVGAQEWQNRLLGIVDGAPEIVDALPAGREAEDGSSK